MPYLGNPGHVEVENRQIITNINIDKGDNNWLISKPNDTVSAVIN